MALTSAKWFRVTNDVVHDLAAGMWPGLVLGMWLVRRGAAQILGAEAVGQLARTWTWVLGVAVAVAAVQIATGAARLSYRYHGIPEEVRTERGKIALAKHAVFVTAAVGALWMAFTTLQD